MNEEELEQLLANSRMQGSSSPGWGAAAGAAASVQNRPTLPKPGDYVGSNLSFLDWLAGTYENRSYNEGIVQGWFDPQYHRKQYEDMSVTERIIFDEEWKARQDPGAYFFNKIKKLAPFPISLLPDVPEGTSYNTDYPPPIEDSLPSNVRGNPITVLPEHPGYPEPSPGNPHKDKPFNFSDWLNENLPPPGPAPEPPEMYKHPHWTEGLGEKDERGIYNTNVRGPQNWRRDGVEQVGNLDYYNLTKDLIGEGSISPYTGGSPSNPWAVNEEYRAWERSNVPTIHADQEKQYQQAVDESHRRYDEMVADMSERERVRQEEYAAEQQRYTDKYNENPYFYDNLLSGQEGGFFTMSDLDWSENFTRHPPEDLTTGPPISQEEIILNQTRPGGGIGLSEQIINQSKPGAYIYPGMLN